MTAISFNTELSSVKMTIKSVVGKMGGAQLKKDEEDYLHYVFTTKVFRFKDDVEFYLDAKNKLIHFRSASRLGYSDLGANRKRMEQITDSLKILLGTNQ